MSSPSSSSLVKFIEKALLATGPFALSYTDPDQKWLIRKHLTSFLQNFPKFDLSTDTFNHNNGTKVQLFLLEGSLHTQTSTIQQLPSIPLTIWVHENYPLTPPLVFINPKNPIPIRTNHTFINTSSGLTNTNYIKTWEHPRSNLLDFIRNLKKVLANDHPFIPTYPTPTPNLSVTKTEALDRLATRLHYDAITIMERTEKEIENLWKLQSEVKQRSESVRTIINDLETEKETLKERALKVNDDTHVLTIWVEKNYQRLMKLNSGDVEIEEMFEVDDEDDEKKLVMESLVIDEAIEDVMSVLEEATEKGKLEIGLYLKQVRVLAREQFFSRFIINHSSL
ncbi:hypothetical protein AALP_AA4G170500 [Arabis alpina]|uniref:UEV domain-containing protein n=1 Tax=Arabis alpina TaxID=50452 RepID=A0A087H3T3_ARAAL|nr:hypothetical protein AALP_AA4G170500 [Arabis alpina]